MSEPLEMTLDFGPYFRLLKRKPDPKKMSDDELSKQLAQVRRLPDHTRPYAGTFVMCLVFMCAAVGYTAMALGAATPAFWMIGAGVVMWKGGGKVLQMAARRAHSDVASLEGEIQSRETIREMKRQHDLAEAERQKIANAAAIARRAQEAFDRALDDGLPLEKPIAVHKSPIRIKMPSAPRPLT
ncbi:MAG: hypothetical protein ACAH80_00110 [Alphaproteobacteria bacterium]